MSTEPGPHSNPPPATESIADALRVELATRKARLEAFESQWEEAVLTNKPDERIVGLSRRIVEQRRFIRWLEKTLIENGHNPGKFGNIIPEDTPGMVSGDYNA